VSAHRPQAVSRATMLEPTCQPPAGALNSSAVAEIVTPNEIAKRLAVTEVAFRNWLREQKTDGHALVAPHEYRTHYRFTGSWHERHCGRGERAIHTHERDQPSRSAAGALTE
jgi:hypothetical protein